MESNQKSVLQASLLVALSGILYGFLGFLGTKVLEENVNIPSMLFWRFFIAGCCMLPLVIRGHTTNKPFNIDKRSLFFIFTIGTLGYSGSSGFYFLASEYAGTGLAMVIFYSFPILIAVYSWLTEKNSFNITTFLLLIAMMSGLILLGKDNSAHSFNFTGIAFGTASALSYASYIVGSKKYASKNTDSNVLTMLVSFGCALFFLVGSIINGTFVVPPTIKSWIALLALSVFATALPILLMLEGLKRISSMRASIISVLEPIVTVLVGIILLEETILPLQVLGVIVILGSAILVQFQKNV